MSEEKDLNEESNSNDCIDVVTNWRNFNDELPEKDQEIYVLDRFGQIEETTHQGDWQKKYWIMYGYVWTTRPASR